MLIRVFFIIALFNVALMKEQSSLMKNEDYNEQSNEIVHNKYTSLPCTEDKDSNNLGECSKKVDPIEDSRDGVSISTEKSEDDLKPLPSVGTKDVDGGVRPESDPENPSEPKKDDSLFVILFILFIIFCASR